MHPLILTIGLFFAALALQASNDTLADDEIYSGDISNITSVERGKAMPELANSKLGKILTRYYKQGLGGPANWAKIESLRLNGQLKIGDESFEVTSYQKKPNLVKMIIETGNQDLVLGYDGQVAWQLEPSPEPVAKLMDESDSRRLVTTSALGGHLIYPFTLGKEISFVDTKPVKGIICNQVRVTLENGFQIDYFIDVQRHLGIKVRYNDLKTGRVYSVTYHDYNMDHEMPIAYTVRSFEDGKWVSSFVISDVGLNTGLMPWMFKMPED